MKLIKNSHQNSLKRNHQISGDVIPLIVTTTFATYRLDVNQLRLILCQNKRYLEVN